MFYEDPWFFQTDLGQRAKYKVQSAKYKVQSTKYEALSTCEAS